MIHVLIVSDHPVVRTGFGAMLGTSDDIQTVGEASLMELRGQVESLRPDVIVLDLVGGDSDVLEDLWQLSSEVPNIAVLALSRHPGEAQAKQALQAGVRGYLLWDVSSEELIAAVRAVHQGLTVLHQAAAQAILSEAISQSQENGVEPLTPREREVLQMLAQGLPSKTIASRLHVSEHTVKFHVGSIMGKLGAASRTQAVTNALRRGLITL